MSDETNQQGDQGGSSSDDVQVKLEQLQKERDELIKAKEELEKIKPEYEKLKDKDFNFSNLRKAKEAKEKVLEGMSEKEKMLLEEQESLKERQERLEKEAERTRESTKSRLLRRYAGEDKVMQDKVMFHYERIKDEVYTEDEVERKMADAAKLAEAPMKQVSMGLAASSYGIPDRQSSKKKSFTDTDEGKELIRKMGLSI